MLGHAALHQAIVLQLLEHRDNAHDEIPQHNLGLDLGGRCMDVGTNDDFRSKLETASGRLPIWREKPRNKYTGTKYIDSSG